MFSNGTTPAIGCTRRKSRSSLFKSSSKRFRNVVMWCLTPSPVPARRASRPETAEDNSSSSKRSGVIGKTLMPELVRFAENFSLQMAVRAASENNQTSGNLFQQVDGRGENNNAVRTAQTGKSKTKTEI